MSVTEDASISLETLGLHTWWMECLLSMETAVSSNTGLSWVPLLHLPCSTESSLFSLLPPSPTGLQTTCPAPKLPPVPTSELFLTLFPQPL